MKNEVGVTMASLVITIAVIVILISITGYYSISNVKNGVTASEQKELSDVIQYVAILKAKLLIDEFNVDSSKILKSVELKNAVPALSDKEFNTINEVNSSNKLNDNYKYCLVEPDDLADKSFSQCDILVKDASNKYIINFYTGTIIAIYDNGKRIERSGIIKDLNTILDEL